MYSGVVDDQRRLRRGSRQDRAPRASSHFRVKHTVSDTGNESSGYQLAGPMCRSLDDGSDDHDGTSPENGLASTEVVAPDGGDHAPGEAADVVKRDDGSEEA